jgi:cAMP-dependent protein kinase regulator
MAQEHQEYIQSKVNPTLENLVTQVLLERPDNPVPFMIQWLAQQTKASPTLEVGEAERLRKEIATLQAEVGELEAKVGPVAGGTVEAAAREEEEEEEEEEDDVDDADLPPPPSSYLKKGPRASVSAEAYGNWNQVKDFTPPVHPKTEEQKQRILGVITSSFLFATLEQASLDIIVNAMLEKEVAPDTRVIQEGDDGDVMYVIEKGAIECLKKIDGAEKVVKSCGPGDFFGELALLYNCPRAASVEAREASVLWQLDRETFNAIVRDASMKKREMYDTFLKSIPILESLDAYERSSLADALHKESVAAGSTVITQGDSGERFYLVESGELNATKAGGDGVAKDVMKYKKGDYFGELALVKNEARAASITAITDCTLMSIDRKTFKSLLGSVEDIMKRKAAEYA